ncbi:MAG: hypothetical protein NTV21_05830 [Planctomycetota bacterium]|nr:hypothetical protein [Planctomycetota bacterium]
MVSRLRVTLVLAVLALALILVLRRSTPELRDTGIPIPEVQAAARAPDLAMEPAEPQAPPEEPRLEPEARELDLGTPSASTAPQRPLRGRVVAEMLTGERRTDLSGKLELSWKGSAATLASEVEFVQGVLQETIELGSEPLEIHVRTAGVEGRRFVVVEPMEFVPLAESGEITVLVRELKPSILKVTDAVTGLELDNVTLVLAPFPRGRDATHPGLEFSERKIADGLVSPIALDPFGERWFRWNEVHLFVGAPGHAWTRLQFDWSAGGSAAVALAPAGSLAIDVSGVEPGSGTRLWVCGLDPAHPWFECALESDRVIEIEGVPVGRSFITAGMGVFEAEQLALAEASVQIVAGAHHKVTLVLDAAPVVEKADISGVLHIATGWNVKNVEAFLHLRSTSIGPGPRHFMFTGTPVASERAGFDTFRWSAEGLQVGRHALTTFEPPAEIEFELSPDGRREVELEIGPPIEALLRLVDASNGEPIRTDALSWGPDLSGHQLASPGVSATFDAARGGYPIRSPAPSICVMLNEPGFAMLETSLQLGPGPTEHVLRLTRVTALQVELRCEGAKLPVPELWGGSPVDLAGKDAALVTFFSSNSRLFQLSGPGTFVLRPPALAGYRVPPPARIDVGAGETRVLVVEYERLR